MGRSDARALISFGRPCGDTLERLCYQLGTDGLLKVLGARTGTENGCPRTYRIASTGSQTVGRPRCDLGLQSLRGPPWKMRKAPGQAAIAGSSSRLAGSAIPNRSRLLGRARGDDGAARADPFHMPVHSAHRVTAHSNTRARLPSLRHSPVLARSGDPKCRTKLSS
jgi:hypothetical protein